MDETFIRYAMPALVAGVFGIASALITARISGGAERRRAEREANSQLDAWRREFSARYAELQATNRPHAETLRQQFAKAYIREEGPDPKIADRWFIPAGAKLIIGRRAEECDIAIDDDRLSRRSAMLEMIGNKLFITDLESRNGTAVNRQMLRPGQRYPLAEGDRIQWGQRAVTVHMLPD